VQGARRGDPRSDSELGNYGGGEVGNYFGVLHASCAFRRFRTHSPEFSYTVSEAA
jgi:hypothetical protein